jgi:TolB-like protein
VESGRQAAGHSVGATIRQDICFLVIARNSAFTYKGEGVPVQRVGRDLGVRYVLEGSVRKSADRVRIGVQLADVGTIAASVVAAVEPPLYAAEKLC